MSFACRSTVREETCVRLSNNCLSFVSGLWAAFATPKHGLDVVGVRSRGLECVRFRTNSLRQLVLAPCTMMLLRTGAIAYQYRRPKFVPNMFATRYEKGAAPRRWDDPRKPVDLRKQRTMREEGSSIVTGRNADSAQRSGVVHEHVIKRTMRCRVDFRVHRTLPDAAASLSLLSQHSTVSPLVHDLCWIPLSHITMPA